jgi:hypothetical protein
MHPTQHSTHYRKPRNAQELLTQAVTGLQTLSLTAALKNRPRLNIESTTSPLLRKHAPTDDVEHLDEWACDAQGRIFRPTTSTREAA